MPVINVSFEAMGAMPAVYLEMELYLGGLVAVV
jgi:hypothetical protein